MSPAPIQHLLQESMTNQRRDKGLTREAAPVDICFIGFKRNEARALNQLLQAFAGEVLEQSHLLLEKCLCIHDFHGTGVAGMDSPWEKFSRATFIPARISCSRTGGVFDAGPMVATIRVLSGGSIFISRLHTLSAAVELRRATGPF